MMTYKQLQTALKVFKAEGLTQIKLNSTKDLLQAEYDRLTVAPETVTETVTEAVTEAVIEPEVNPTTDNDTSEIVITETLTITYHSFKEILRQRKSSFRPKAQGFKIVKPEKRYDQLTVDEWREDTLAFLDDNIIYDECDYMAA
jgi:hypothetical protein